MRDLRSYVVKIYRQQAETLAGTVQEVRTGRTVPFQTMEELWQAVRTTPPRLAAGSSRRRRMERAHSERPDSSEPDVGSESNEKRN